LDWKRSRDIWWLWQSPQGLISAIYNDFTEKWHILAVDFDTPGSTDSASALERIGEFLRQASGEDVRLSNPAWVHTGSSVSQRIAEHYVTGRAALAGDAAHVFSSLAGQGLHFAIEDAVNLGWKLGLTIAGAAAPSLLETYETERRGHANHVIRRTRVIQRFLMLPTPVRKAAWKLL
jgi:2-polyprenyl-6-methoxyphenol hydroxylase-like FAD-dependent oxidoreductase